MKIPTRILLTACSIALLLACSAKEDPEGVLSQGHKDALQKAEGVEQLLQDAEQKKLQDLDATTD